MNDRAKTIDVLIIGGGVNGAGIACDAAGRGLSVVLCEQDDLASATSSASSKLIHGGLRYLEHYEFGLVRKALIEREILLANAPHIIRPLRFILPHRNSVRPAWMIRTGLFLYDHLARHPALPDSGGVNMAKDIAGAPLDAGIKKGFSYYDCLVDDARLVILNAMAARDRGAEILTRTRLVSAQRSSGIWRAELVGADGSTYHITSRTLVNAAGPWAADVLDGALGMATGPRLMLVKGSHIIVPRLYDGDHAYILQNHDRRVVFVIPFAGDLSMVGTTEVPFLPIHGDPSTATIEDDEVDYLCDAVSRYFRKPMEPGDVVATFSGVRPLYDDAPKNTGNMSKVSRDYMLALDGTDSRPPLLSVMGGKITTYRRLAEDAMDRLKPWFPDMGEAWTAGAPLPGGDIPGRDVVAFRAALATATPGIDADYIGALVARHGTLAAEVLGDASTMTDLGRDFGAGLYGREIDYFIRREWAETAVDVLWRRTKAGFHLDEAARDAVADYMATSRRAAVG